ncbi:hypothetical protein B0H14DRAFT_3146073 [Mycena olivaceomarginata]|nr:hypothetical protein B0H14DRAFT_3146073 [Mycena olivaceomarginata]
MKAMIGGGIERSHTSPSQDQTRQTRFSQFRHGETRAHPEAIGVRSDKAAINNMMSWDDGRRVAMQLGRVPPGYHRRIFPAFSQTVPEDPVTVECMYILGLVGAGSLRRASRFGPDTAYSYFLNPSTIRVWLHQTPIVLAPVAVLESAALSGTLLAAGWDDRITSNSGVYGWSSYEFPGPLAGKELEVVLLRDAGSWPKS